MFNVKLSSWISYWQCISPSTTCRQLRPSVNHTFNILFLPVSSELRSFSLAVRAFRSIVRSLIRLASTLDFDRSFCNSSSAALSLLCSWPFDRSASASSSFICAALASELPAASVAALVALPEDAFSDGGGGGCLVEASHTAFSASRAAIRSASWEPIGHNMVSRSSRLANQTNPNQTRCDKRQLTSVDEVLVYRAIPFGFLQRGEVVGSPVGHSGVACSP